MRHTPGPWSFDTYNNVMAKGGHHKYAPERVEICSIPDHPEQESDGYKPEQIAERGWWYSESESNAILIAAAPDLADLVLRTYTHVSHGGPTRAEAEAVLKKAGLL